ncbi:hypothetical protein SPHINGOR109_50730 [Sphingorhabdus sp. 109]|nr:hypothetical protein SPHINGOR109_50730 [Sphingorhabdus sp. 109]
MTRPISIMSRSPISVRLCRTANMRRRGNGSSAATSRPGAAWRICWRNMQCSCLGANPVILVKAGIQPKGSEVREPGLGPSLRWGDKSHLDIVQH